MSDTEHVSNSTGGDPNPECNCTHDARDYDADSMTAAEIIAEYNKIMDSETSLSDDVIDLLFQKFTYPYFYTDEVADRDSLCKCECESIMTDLDTACDCFVQNIFEHHGVIWERLLMRLIRIELHARMTERYNSRRLYTIRMTGRVDCVIGHEEVDGAGITDHQAETIKANELVDKFEILQTAIHNIIHVMSEEVFEAIRQSGSFYGTKAVLRDEFHRLVEMRRVSDPDPNVAYTGDAGGDDSDGSDNSLPDLIPVSDDGSEGTDYGVDTSAGTDNGE